MSSAHLAKLFAWFVALGWLLKALTAWRGLRTIPNLLESSFNRGAYGSPSITVIVPARDEQAAIVGCLRSLLQQDDPHLQVIAVNDRSSDATGALMDEIAAQYPNRLTVLHVRQLPDGWLGKTHAMALAARHAIAIHRPQYLLFTDADVYFHPEAIRRSLAQAVATEADHFVTIPTPLIESYGEGVLLGCLSVLGMWVTRLWKASDPRSMRDAVGIGAFNLLRTEAYEQIGGFEALRMQVLEDLTLARRVKEMGLKQRVAAAPGMVTLHWAAGAMGIVKVMTKNLFAVLGYRIPLVLLTCLWLILFCLSPVAFLLSSETRLAGIVACISIVALYRLSQGFSRISAGYAVLFPFGVLLFLYSWLRSTATIVKDGGVTWRGTFYPLAELRKAL